MFKVNNKDTRIVFIVDFEHISHLVLVFLLLTLNMQLPAGMKDNVNKENLPSNVLCFQENKKHINAKNLQKLTKTNTKCIKSYTTKALDKIDKNSLAVVTE